MHKFLIVISALLIIGIVLFGCTGQRNDDMDQNVSSNLTSDLISAQDGLSDLIAPDELVSPDEPPQIG